MKKEFKQLLEEMGCVTPGKCLGEVKVLFLGRECFENLGEQEVQVIYDLHQREIILKAKKGFQELLLERADLFYQFRYEEFFLICIFFLRKFFLTYCEKKLFYLVI